MLVKPEAPSLQKKYKTFSILNTERFEKKNLEPSLPALLDFPV